MDSSRRSDVTKDAAEDRQLADLERKVVAVLNSELSFLEVGDFICESVREIDGAIFPSILTIDGAGRLRPWATEALPVRYCQLIDGLPVGEGVGSCGTAAFRGTPVISESLSSDPLWAPYQHLLPLLEMMACWSYPIRNRLGHVVGTFALYSKQEASPTAFHERIMNACSHLCALAIERQEANIRLDAMINTDALTGLPTRQQLERGIGEFAAGSEMGGISALTIGIDRFSDVNDAFGRETGDAVLVCMANRIRTVLEVGGLLVRGQGDGFILISRTVSEGAVRVAEEVLSVIAAPCNYSGVEFSLTASIGISSSSSFGVCSAVLLTESKVAMNRVRSQGGKGYAFYSVGMKQSAGNRLLLRHALRKAIDSDLISLVFQPQVSIATGEVYGVETLARWKDESFGSIPPDTFIAMAEESGQIDALTKNVLRRALAEFRGWLDSGLKIPVISLNFSPLNLADSSLVGFLNRLMSQYDISGDKLCIEITESTVLSATGEMMEVLHKLRALGVGLSIDDLGTGFSSMTSLAKLPLTELKIDRSFVAGCDLHGPTEKVLLGMIGLGRSLGFSVVAEGVETEAQYQWLLARGCTAFQGYYIARPMSSDELVLWMRRRMNS